MFILERYDTYLLQLMHLLLMHMIQSAHYSFLGSIFLYWSWPFVVFFFYRITETLVLANDHIKFRGENG